MTRTGADPDTGLDELEAGLGRLLELTRDPAASEADLVRAWHACARAQHALPERPAPEQRARLAALLRLNGLVLERLERERASTAAALERLRGSRAGLAFYRSDAAGDSCDVTG